MSAGLIFVVSCIYATVGVLQFRDGSYQDGVIWAGYTLANIGFIWRYWG